MKTTEFSSKKNKKTYYFIIWAALLATLPVLMCLIRFLATSVAFGELWPSGSTWNDEAFYFKQTESMVKFGLPQGFFGYNESSAPNLTFGAWAPIILAPGALFGKIFGFTAYTPFVFNASFLTLSLLLFGLLSKIDLGSMSGLYLTLFVFIPLSRFMLSYMPEIMILGFCIILLGLYLSAEEEPHFVKDTLMYLILIYLVILRPYFAVLFLFPIMSAFRRRGKSKLLYILLSAVVMAVGLFGYKYITDKFTAPYFEDIYSDWFSKIFTHGPHTVFNEVMERLHNNVLLLQFRIEKSINLLDSVGAYYAIYLVMSLLLPISAAISFLCIRLQSTEEEKKQPVTYHKVILFVLMFIAQATVLLAILILYNVEDGYRHLLGFIILDMLLLLSEKKTFASFKFFSIGICLLLSIFYFLMKGDIPESYEVPSLDAESPVRAEFRLSKDELKNEMPLSEGISWKNTVDVYYKPDSTDLEIFYLIPEGFGINLCSLEYLEQNIATLKSGYLIVPKDTVEVIQGAEDNGFEVVTEVTGGYTVLRNVK